MVIHNICKRKEVMTTTEIEDSGLIKTSVDLADFPPFNSKSFLVPN